MIRKNLTDFGFLEFESNAPVYFIDTERESKMKIPVEKSLKLDDGKHEGKIEDIKYRDDPYQYTDVVIKVDDATLTVGYPTKITEDSALGKLLTRFGAKLEIGTDTEPEEFLTKGKEVVFQTLTTKSKKDGNEYSNVIRESLKPKE